MKTWILSAALLALGLPAAAQTAALQGYCDKGGTKTHTQNLSSTNYSQGDNPHCTITVYLTGTTTKATLYSNAGGTILGNPFTANTITGQLPGKWIFWAAINQGYDVVASGGDAPNTYPAPVTLCTDCYAGSSFSGSPTVVEVNSTPISPASPANFVDTATVTWAFVGGQIKATSAGGGGCSVGGIPTTGGIVDGDVTSTNCGTNNRASDTAGSPANVQTFGYTNGTGNSGTDVVLMGKRNGVGNQATDLVAIGDANAYHSGSAPLQGQHLIGIGTGTLGTSDFYGAMTASLGDFIAIGNGAGSMFHSSTASDAIAIGNGAGADWIGSTNNIIGIGNGGASDHNGSDNVVGIGNGSATGSTPSGSPPAPTTNVTEVVGVGDGAAGKNNGNNVIAFGNAAGAYNAGNEVIAAGHWALHGTASLGHNTGTENIAIGDHANTANTSGAHNVVMGDFAGANGWVSAVSLGNANLTGSNNTWIGDFAGPNTTSQLSNTFALGYQAYVSASNSGVIGNPSITQTDIYGTTTIHGAGTINGFDVPGGTDATGTAGHYKLWASTANGCWMITNGTGSPACIPTSGGGTPGGSNTQVQFNNSTAFGGDANFRWVTGTGLILPLDTPNAITAGSGAADPFTTWNFVNAPTTLPASTYRLALLAQMTPTLGADETTVHWSALEGLAIPGDDHNYHDLFGGQLQGFTNKAGNIGEMDGGAFAAIHAGSGTITLQIGGKVTSVAQSTGSITNNYGAQITTGNQGTGSIGTNYGLDIPSTDGSGPITTNYGLHIGNQTGGATNWAIKTGLGLVSFGDAVTAPSVKTTAYTVAGLPSAATLGAGAQVVVSDATTFTPGTCTGGGSDYMIAVSNGASWSCH